MKIDSIEGFSTLKDKTKRWLRLVDGEYDMDQHTQRLLILAGAAYDRALEAKRIVDIEGPFFLDRFEQKKPHPMLEVEKQSSLTFTRILRECGLDLVAPDDSRPPRQY